MASAAPPKRMVSSVFITLASPCRATVTQQQHALQTHNAPERDVQHTAVRVQPSDSVHTQRRKKDSSSSESSSSSSSSSADSVGPIHPAPLLQDKPSDSKPAVTHPRLSLANTDQQRAQVHTRGSDELVPLSPSLPLSVGTELSGDSAPPLSPALREAPSLPLDTSQSQPYNKQLPTFKPEPRTPSSGGVQDEQSQGSYNCHQEMSPESNEVCGFCRKTVALNEPAVEALNRTYHDGCFQCRQCHVPLAGKLYYNKAGIPLCEECYQASLELCWACGEVIKDHVIRALERTYHPPCFTCATCSQQIGEQRFAQGEVGEVYCLQDYYRKYAPQCSACNQLIIPRADGIDSYTVECLGRSFHEECYRCEICDIQLSPDPNDYGCYPLDGRVLCKSCHLSLVSAQH